MSKKLDLFKTLGSLSKGNTDWFNLMDEPERKQVVPLILMRWMTGTDDAVAIIMMNEIVNTKVFSLYNHQQLLVNLLGTASPQRFTRYKWIKGPSKTKSSKPITIKLLSEIYNYSHKESESNIKLLNMEACVSMAEYHGWTDTEISKIIKEWGGKVPIKSNTNITRPNKTKVNKTVDLQLEDIVEF